MSKIKVITGCMESGKSEKLIEKAESYDDVLYIQPNVQGIHNEINIYDNLIEFIQVDNPNRIEAYLTNEDAVVIDKAHFFKDETIVDKIEEILAKKDVDFIISGLDKDFRGEPFSPVDSILAIADEVHKTKSECVICGSTATMTQRLINGEPASKEDEVILLGEEKYEPRCRKCHIVY